MKRYGLLAIVFLAALVCGVALGAHYGRRAGEAEAAEVVALQLTEVLERVDGLEGAARSMDAHVRGRIDRCEEWNTDDARRLILDSTLVGDVLRLLDARVACSALFGPMANTFTVDEPLAEPTPGAFLHRIDGADRATPLIAVRSGAAVALAVTRDILSAADEAMGLNFVSHEATDGGPRRTRSFHVCSDAIDLCLSASRPFTAHGRVIDMKTRTAALLGGVFVSIVSLILYALGTWLNDPRFKAWRVLYFDAFGFQYQPIIALASGKTIGAEMLLRPHPRYRSVRVPDIIDTAREMQRSHLIAQKALRTGLNDFGDRLRGSASFVLTINVPPSDLIRDDFVDRFTSIVDARGVPRSRIAIEITESESAAHRDVAAAIKTLSAAGFTIALDDFGTGYANLGYLGELDADWLKLDRSITAAAGTGSGREVVLKRILEMTRDLKIDVVAEGIETELQEQYFRAVGCLYGQGWRFSRSLTPPELEVWEMSFTPVPEQLAVESRALGIA